MNIKGKATLINLNVGKQGNEEEQDLRVDLKLHFESVDAACLVPVLGVESFDEIRHLWSEDEHHDFILHGVSGLSCWGEFRESHKIRAFNMNEPVSKLHKITFKPIAGYNADLTLTASITDPKHKFRDKMLDAIKQDFMVTIEQTQDDLFDNPDEEEENGED